MNARGTDAASSEQRLVVDAYGIALAALLFSTLMLVSLATSVTSLVTGIAAMLQITALALTMRVSGATRRMSNVGIGLAVVLLIVSVAAATSGSASGHAVALGGWLLLVLSTIAAILRRLAQYRSVTMPLVMGLLCIYLLLGMAFGLTYAIAGVIAPPVFTQGEGTVSTSVYFSFVTLATVGYGDFTPANAVVRAVAVAEAMLGQLYLVSVVAAAVGRLGAGRRAPRVTDDGSEPDVGTP